MSQVKPDLQEEHPMNRRSFLAIAFVPLLTAGGRAMAQEGQQWVQLFTGKDLTGWKTHPKNPGTWRVENGVLVSDGRKVSHLFSARGDYRDFDFRIEAMISDKGN